MSQTQDNSEPQRKLDPGNKSTNFRRQYALLQRSLVTTRWAEEVSNIGGGKVGVDGFRNLLKNRFGTLTCAWRTALDSNSKGRLPTPTYPSWLGVLDEILVALMCKINQVYICSFQVLWLTENMMCCRLRL